jgi:Uma2 family endonuclease
MVASVALETALLAALAERQDRCELVDGVIVPVNPAGYFHGAVIAQITYLLKVHVLRAQAGQRVIAGDSGFIWDERNVRAPDIAVVARADAERAPASGFIPFSPLLVIEVVSPSDSWRAVHMKAQGWLDHGATSVWVVDPEDRLLVIHHPDRTQRELRAEDVVNDAALPGFTCTVAEFFA